MSLRLSNRTRVPNRARHRCPDCNSQLQGYVEVGSNKTKWFCQNTTCRSFMCLVQPRILPRTIDVKPFIRRLP